MDPPNGRTQRPLRPTSTPQQLQSVRATLRSPRRLKTEALAGLVVALALIPEAIAFSVIAAVILAGVFQILLAVLGVTRLMRFIPRSVMVVAGSR